MSDQLHVEIEPERLRLEPGSPADAAVRVVNLGEVVEEYELSVVGLPPGVGRVEPPRLSLLPDQEGEARVVLDASGGNVPAGTQVAGVRVASRSRADVAYVAELPVEVAAVQELQLHLTPQTLRAGSSGWLRAELRNGGNQPVDVTLRGTDDEGAVAFRFQPERLRVAPGASAASNVEVSAPRPMTGAARHRQLHVTAGDAEARATFVQKPRVSAVLLSALGALVALLLVGAVALCADGNCLGTPTVEGDLAGNDDATGDGAGEQGTDGPDEPTDPGTAPPTGRDTDSTEGTEEVEPVLVTVGDLVGSTREEAAAALSASGLTLGGVVDSESLDADPGVVLSQDPAPGTEVEEGTPVSLVVSAGPPPFEPGGDNAVVADLNAPAGAFTARGIPCPDGQSVLAGGGGTLGEDLPDSLVMLRNSPGTLGGVDSWATGFRNEGPEVLVRFSVLCGPTPEGYQQSSVDVELEPGGFRAQVVSCPAGTSPISGGAAVIGEGSADHGVVLRQSGPGGTTAGSDTWVTAAENLDTVAHTLRFHAVCVAPGAAFSVETAEVELAPGGVAREVVVCPEGGRLLGGGVTVDDPAPGLVRTLVAESTPGTVRGGPADAWRATLRSDGDVPRPVIVSAICGG